MHSRMSKEINLDDLQGKKREPNKYKKPKFLPTYILKNSNLK